MAGDRIDVDLDDLRRVTRNLARFETEFEAVADRTGRVAAAVRHPTGDGRLRERVTAFESGWDGNRQVVCESLANVRAHLEAFVESIGDLDRSLVEEAP